MSKTLPPPATETASIEAFESAIRAANEQNARLAHMTARFWGLDHVSALSSLVSAKSSTEAA